MSTRRYLFRPSLWTGLIALTAYWNDTALHGKFIYDDVASLKTNVVVNGQVPWNEVITRDFWGNPLKESRSHKSYRPITTLTFRWNWILSEYFWKTIEPEEAHTYGFHVVNVCLHALVTGLVTEVAAWVFPKDVTAQILTGLLFGLHPVHAEAVSNITSRGELLMSLFFLLAFLSLAHHPSRQQGRFVTTVLFVYMVPWICMTLSLFSKEQGATTLITLTIWDFLRHHTSVREYFLRLVQREPSAVSFLRRTVLYALQTISVVILRIWLNGESNPDFIYEQNPAGLSQDRFTRVFSVNWVYCLYIRDAIYPWLLAPDWSGVGIDLITTWSDPRIYLVFLLWTFVLLCGASLFLGLPATTSKRVRDARTVLLTAVFAFLISPFILSSNLLVVVGLAKADRVIYLPLLGFCLIQVLLFQLLFERTDKVLKNENRFTTLGHTTLPKTSIKTLGYFLMLTQFFLFAQKVHERNVAWSDPLYLWWSAYQVNPKSHHTRFNAAYHLSKNTNRNDEVEFLLRPIIDPFDGKPPTDSFLYAMILKSLGRCEESLELVEEAFYAIELLRQEGRVRNTEESLARSESDLLIAKALCTEDFALRGQLMYEACQVDTTNGYAMEMYSKALEQLQLMKQMLKMQGR